MPPSEPDVASSIRRRHDAWFLYFGLWNAVFWCCGIIGVGSSVLAASDKVSGPWAPYYAVVSSLCFAVIGFANPQRRASGYIRAWRVVGSAVLRFDTGQISLPQLIDIVDQGESAISEADGEPAPLSSATRAAAPTTVVPPQNTKPKEQPAPVIPQVKTVEERKNAEQGGAAARPHDGVSNKGA
jgi:hypothetical protein